MLLALLALDNQLVLIFMGLSPALAAPLIVATCAAIWWLASQPFAGSADIPVRVVVISMILALCIFMVGGEGRVFYANLDWEARDAVLADMAGHKWPVSYLLYGASVILRAPLGMYLQPALTGKWHDVALLFSNALRLALLFSLGWQLFDTTARRVFAVIVLVLFSGWDIIGTMLMSGLGYPVSWDHIEAWSLGYQYSSDVTLAFWAPNHAIAGWTYALTFELWRRGRAPIGLFAAAVPLAVIWSPLALMGAVPFVLIAGITALLRRAFTWRDIVLAGLAVAIAIPSLCFLSLDAVAVVHRLRSPGILVYLAILALEVLPLVLPPLFSKSAKPQERVILWAILICLMFMPFYQISTSSDFQMRCSIMPLALLAFAFIDWVIRLADQRPLPRAIIAYAIVTLLIGAVTPALEIHRALVNRPTPAPLCSLITMWFDRPPPVAQPTTYIARTSALPKWLQSVPPPLGLHDPAQCWDRAWKVPRD